MERKTTRMEKSSFSSGPQPSPSPSPSSSSSPSLVFSRDEQSSLRTLTKQASSGKNTYVDTQGEALSPFSSVSSSSDISNLRRSSFLTGVQPSTTSLGSRVQNIPAAPTTLSIIKASSRSSSKAPLDASNLLKSADTAALPKDEDEDHEDYSDQKEEASHQDPSTSVTASRLFALPEAQEILPEFRLRVQPGIVKRLKELSKLDPEIEVGSEIADKVDILNILNSSNANLGKIGDMSRNGVKFLEQGRELIRQAQQKLLSTDLDGISITKD